MAPQGRDTEPSATRQQEYNKSYLAINIYHTLGTMHIVFKLPQEYKRIAAIVKDNINTHVLAFPFKKWRSCSFTHCSEANAHILMLNV